MDGSATDESVIFEAEVKAFSISRDHLTTLQNCSHVILRHHENNEHKIVMRNYTQTR